MATHKGIKHMSKQAGTQKTHSMAKTVEAVWHIVGRGKNAKYYVATPAKDAAKGDHVHIIAKSHPGIMKGILTEYEMNDDGMHVFSFERNMTPEDMAKYNAAKLQARADWQASDKGIESMQKRAARAAKRAAESGEQAPAKVESKQAPAGPVSNDAAIPTVNLPDLIAANLAAGLVPAEAVAAAMQTMDALSASLRQPAAPAAQTASKPRQTVKQAPAASDVGDCQSCKRSGIKLHAHPSGYSVCAQCNGCDVDTVTLRATRKAAKQS